jgi:hypothetical protein
MSNIVRDSVSANLNIGARNYSVLEATVNLSIAATNEESKVTIFVEREQEVPEINEEIKLEINDETVYGGFIKNIQFLETNQKMKLTCQNVIRQLKNKTYTSPYARDSSTSDDSNEESESIETIGFPEETPYEKTIKKHIEDIVEEELAPIGYDTSNIKFTFEQDVVSVDVSNPSDDYYKNKRKSENSVGYGAVCENGTFTLDVEEKSIKTIFDKLAEISGSVWYVNEENDIVFGKAEEKEENSDGEPYTIEHIRKRESGEYTPPYRGVKIIGPDASRKDDERPLHDIACIYENYIVKRGEEPFYVYKTEDIRTKSQAEIAAQNMFDKIKGNKNYGNIQAVVDTQKIKPGMVIEYPTLIGHPFVVHSVKHEINSDEGFFSTIQIESLVEQEEDNSSEFEESDEESTQETSSPREGLERDF